MLVNYYYKREKILQSLNNLQYIKVESHANRKPERSILRDMRDLLAEEEMCFD